MPIAHTDVTDQVILDSDRKSEDYSNNIAIIDNTNDSLSNYAKYVDGYSITVAYYSFNRGVNGENSLLDPNDDTQQYTRIKQLVVTTETPLSPDVNYEGLTMEIKIDSNLVPGENDIVIITMPNGILGMFRVSAVDKKTHLDNYVYYTTLVFLYTAKAAPTYYNSLLDKVVREYVYDDTIDYSNPIVPDDVFTKRVNIKTIYEKLMNEYLSVYLREGLLSYDTESGKVFDPYLQEFILSLIDVETYSRLKVVELNDDESILPTIIAKSISIHSIKTGVEILPLEYDESDYNTISILSSDITYIVKLVDSALDVTTTTFTNIPNNYTDEIPQYLFTSNFYNDSNEVTALESLLKQYINNDIISFDAVHALYLDITNWSYMEKFYYIPLLLLLMKYSLANNLTRI